MIVSFFIQFKISGLWWVLFNQNLDMFILYYETLAFLKPCLLYDFLWYHPRRESGFLLPGGDRGSVSPLRFYQHSKCSWLRITAGWGDEFQLPIGIPWWEWSCYLLLGDDECPHFLRYLLTSFQHRWEGYLITTGWQQKSRLPKWSLLTLLVDISLLGSDKGPGYLLRLLMLRNWEILSQLDKGECLGSSLRVCWHGWGLCQFFLWCSAWVRAVVTYNLFVTRLSLFWSLG